MLDETIAFYSCTRLINSYYYCTRIFICIFTFLLLNDYYYLLSRCCALWSLGGLEVFTHPTTAAAPQVIDDRWSIIQRSISDFVSLMPCWHRMNVLDALYCWIPYLTYWSTKLFNNCLNSQFFFLLCTTFCSLSVLVVALKYYYCAAILGKVSLNCFNIRSFILHAYIVIRPIK